MYLHSAFKFGRVCARRIDWRQPSLRGGVLWLERHFLHTPAQPRHSTLRAARHEAYYH
jgi:hypothetical protein